MSLLDSTGSFIRSVVSIWSTERAKAASRDDPSVVELAAGEHAAGKPSEPPPGAGHAEFDAFLSDLGGTQDAPNTSPTSALQASHIAALESQLQNLRPIGDLLAKADQDLIAAHARIAELEAAAAEAPAEAPAEVPADTPADSAANSPEDDQPADLLTQTASLLPELSRELASVKRKLARRDKSIDKGKERLAAMRNKRDERHRVAADRWREILDLRRERKALEAQIASMESLRHEPQAALPAPMEESQANGLSLAQLMQVDPPDHKPVPRPIRM